MSKEKVIDLINRVRNDPISEKKRIHVTANFLKRAKRVKNSQELESFSKELETIEKLPSLITSPGLCQAAEKMALKMANSRDPHMHLSSFELINIVFPFVQSSEGLFILSDHGDSDNFLARSIVSDHDPDRTYRKAIFSKEYKYIGASVVECDNEDLTVVFFAKNIIEKTQKTSISRDDLMTSEDVIAKINKIRTDPQSENKRLTVTANFLKRAKRTANADELRDFTNGLSLIKPLEALTQNENLNKAARKIGEEALLDTEPIDVHEFLKNYDLENFLNGFFEYVDAPFLLSDRGDAENFLVRSFISDHDQERKYRKAIFSSEFKYIGASVTPLSESEELVVILMVKDLKEFEDLDNQDPQNVAIEDNLIEPVEQLEEEFHMTGSQREKDENALPLLQSNATPTRRLNSSTQEREPDMLNVELPENPDKAKKAKTTERSPSSDAPKVICFFVMVILVLLLILRAVNKTN